MGSLLGQSSLRLKALKRAGRLIRQISAGWSFTALGGLQGEGWIATMTTEGAWISAVNSRIAY